MNSTSIYQCFNCDQLYCAECSNAGSPTDYCSDKCQIEQTALNEAEEEVSEEVVDIVIETTEEPSDSDLREESY